MDVITCMFRCIKQHLRDLCHLTLSDLAARDDMNNYISQYYSSGGQNYLSS